MQEPPFKIRVRLNISCLSDFMYFCNCVSAVRRALKRGVPNGKAARACVNAMSDKELMVFLRNVESMARGVSDVGDQRDTPVVIEAGTK